MRNLELFLSQMGGLHDAVVEKLLWEQSEMTMSFLLNDIYSNFQELPNHPGVRPATITLHGIYEVKFEIDFSGKKLNIDEFSIETSENVNFAKVEFWPDGILKVKFLQATIPEHYKIPDQI